MVDNELATIIKMYYPKLKSLNGAMIGNRLENKWGLYEELGHLVDSAQNNIQRFIRVQYQPRVQISYDPDEWVRANDYLNMDWGDLVELWYLLNKQIVRILAAMPASEYEKQIDVGSTEPIMHPTSFIADDYVVHLQHHLDHIFTV